MNLANKNIILTGASSGIGKEILDQLCQYEGTKIISVARNIGNIPNSRNNVFLFSADLSQKEGVDAVFEYAHRVFGQVDIFIANAGFAYIEELQDADWNHIEDIFSLNVTSVIYSLERFNEQGGSSQRQFVATSSAVAFVPLHAYALYCSSKAALHQFMEAYRYEKDKNLILTTIYPVATRTAFFDHASGKESTPSPWPAQSVENVAKKIIKGVKKNKKRIYPSFLFRVFYPIGRALPFFLKIYSKMEMRKTRKWLQN